MEKFQASICARARREVVIGLALLVVTMGSFLLFFVLNYFHRRDLLEQYLPGAGPERIFYNLIFAVFMYGSFTYQVSRLAFFWNVRSRVASAHNSLVEFMASEPTAAPHVEILVPSYKEESHVIWQTLVSAALADYPNRNIVLLIDNPPNPTASEDWDLLDKARRQISIVAGQFAPLASEFGAAAQDFHTDRPAAATLDVAAQEAAALYEKAAAFLEDLAQDVREGKFGGADDHTRSFFVERILLEPAAAHRERAGYLLSRSFTYEELSREFERLAYMFRFSISSFERKNYVNLSQVATKAANLNSYISLMGRSFDVVRGEEGLRLVEQGFGVGSNDAPASISPSDAEFILVLDADSFLLSNYLTCMISVLTSPGNERVAVMQTPYTSIPNTPNQIERAAGATTDIYYYVTEGMSFARAGSWIGAAAAIRKAALLDIVVYHDERGHSVPIFIQDKTVIEDTGATIDLARRNWTVQNYPARLTYSATPPDFGALVVQRKRWSNGGLIILPSLIRYLTGLRPSFPSLLEGLLRIHYMVMPACISSSMLAMLIYPFDFRHVSSWVYVTLPPYLYLVCRDLVHTGYRRTDFFRAYTLFLILLPVVLVGVLNSIVQIVFGDKANFGRTPKVADRTAVPAFIHLSIWGLFVWSILTGYDDLTSDKELHAVFAGSNALALGYGIFFLIGVRESLQDILLELRTLLVGIKQRLRLRQGPNSGAVSVPLRLVKSPSISAATAVIPSEEYGPRKPSGAVVIDSRDSMQSNASRPLEGSPRVNPARRYVTDSQTSAPSVRPTTSFKK
jgi:cellulose synthase/poly-beta-1,6-N-acetylglucosamine synthase-like glycosyltransferase